MRDSPNGNSYRSDSPDSQSPRDRNYQTKSSYLQKIREKERENRDYKSREKYSGKISVFCFVFDKEFRKYNIIKRKFKIMAHYLFYFCKYPKFE